MDIEALRAFCAIAETGSFSQAARALFLTQPSVSHRIHRLEADLGSPLFRRSPRGVELTESGHRLLPYALRITELAGQARTALEEHAGGGPLRIGTNGFLAHSLVPELLERFYREMPRREVILRTGSSQDLLSRLAGGQIEIALLHLPPECRPAREIRCEPLYADGLIPVGRPDHPLLRRSEVELGDFGPFPLVSHGRHKLSWQVVERYFRAEAVPMREIVETCDIESAQGLVSRGVGLAFLPRVSVAARLERGELASLPLTLRRARAVRLPTCVAYRPAEPLDRDAAAFLGIAREWARDWDRRQAIQAS